MLIPANYRNGSHASFPQFPNPIPKKNIIYKDRWFKMFQLGLQDLAFRCWTEIIGLHLNFFLL